ncbi:hypothetical protein [Parafrankia sp. EUN1f]|uniref:hypothetical protein n=1 Tax=Parafrankia sp. EUN1f TaxID=102897 RepID=UPI000569415C|nr:hypothetical protein [Parafrankia sp. EUN1f]
MTFGELLISVGTGHLVALPGSRAARTLAAGSTSPRLVPAPDEICARLIALAAAELDQGPGACWDGAVLTLLFPTDAPRDPAVPGPGGPVEEVATPAELLRAVSAARSAGTHEIRLRPTFPLDTPLPDAVPLQDTTFPAPVTHVTATPGVTADNADNAADNPISRRLAEIVGTLAAQDEAPLTPARAAADLAETLPTSGFVVAEAGPAGLWIEHAMRPAHGRVRVLRAGGPVALAGALLAGLHGDIGVAVVEDPPVGPAATLLHLASALDVDLVVEVWGQRGGLRRAADHRQRLRAALRGHGVRVIEVPVDFTSTKLLVDALTDDTEDALSAKDSVDAGKHQAKLRSQQ